MPFVEINGVKLYYEVHGAGEPFLLLEVRVWATPQAPAFNRAVLAFLSRHRCLA